MKFSASRPKKFFDVLVGGIFASFFDSLFVKDLVNDYDRLRAAFSKVKADIKETGGWRDDM